MREQDRATVFLTLLGGLLRTDYVYGTKMTIRNVWCGTRMVLVKVNLNVPVKQPRQFRGRGGGHYAVKESSCTSGIMLEPWL